MPGHQCYHCKLWVDEGEAHDCWTTTESALTRDLSEDLQEAYERLRDTAIELGEQRVYASHHSIMFARKSCYFFVRPQRKRLEVVFFAGREIKSPFVRKVVRTSKVRLAHMVHLIHRDQVEAPLTDWLHEAYGLQDAATAPKPAKRKLPPKRKAGAPRKSATRRRVTR